MKINKVGTMTSDGECQDENDEIPEGNEIILYMYRVTQTLETGLKRAENI